MVQPGSTPRVQTPKMVDEFDFSVLSLSLGQQKLHDWQYIVKKLIILCLMIWKYDI